MYLAVWCSVYTHPLAFQLHCNLASAVLPGHSITHCHLGPPTVPAVHLVSATQPTAIENRARITCPLRVLPRTTRGSGLAVCTQRSEYFLLCPLPRVYLFLTVPAGPEGCSWLFCVVNFLLLLQVVDSCTAYIIQSLQDTLETIYYHIFAFKYRSLSL